MRNLIDIMEEFAHAFKYSFGGGAPEQDVIIFRNPDRKEWGEATARCKTEVRAWISGDDVYIWDTYASNHNAVKAQLKLDKTAIPVWLYGSYRGEGHAVVTDTSEYGTIWYHNPKVRDALLDCKGLIRIFKEMDVGYFDEDIVGPWDKIDPHSASEDEEDEQEEPWDYHNDDRHLEEGIRQDAFVKFWIRPDGKVEMLEPGEHHVYALARLERQSPAEGPLSWFGCFKSGWVRGFYEPEGTMNYSFTERRVTPAAIKEMLTLAREYRATSYNLEEAIFETPIGGSEMDPRQFSIYMRSKSRADGPPLNESEADYTVWHTITSSYHGQLDGYCQAESLPDRRAIGYLNFSVFEGKALIKMIEVNENWKRKGVGSALIDCLVKDMKGYENIEWGYTTPDGEALRVVYEKSRLL